jgi:hypothetical protein
MIRILFVLALAGCAADGAPWSGESLPETLTLVSPTEGVHPDRSVLNDPANPFLDGKLGEQTIWDLQSNAGAVGAFYAWATLHAHGPNGERQYYTALNLKTAYERGFASEGDLPALREAAIGGFQAVLDYFPEAVTYDISGTIAYELVTPSVTAILDLGGKVDGWILVMTPDGRTVAVRK